MSAAFKASNKSSVAFTKLNFAKTPTAVLAVMINSMAKICHVYYDGVEREPCEQRITRSSASSWRLILVNEPKSQLGSKKFLSLHASGSQQRSTEWRPA